MRAAICPVYLGVVLIAGVLAAPADSHFKPGRHNVVHAINLAWCGRSNFYCPNGREARAVATCESHLRPRATNGIYWGLFQQGSWSRGFGHWRWDPWSQAKSAHAAWVANRFCWTCNQQWPVCGQGLD